MKRRTAYECEICGARFRHATMAEVCEESHGDPDPSKIKILRCHYDVGDNLVHSLVLNIESRKWIPRALTVRYGPGPDEVAQYHLIRIGPQKGDGDHE